MGFFFLTYRSNTMGLAFAMSTPSASGKVFELPYVAVTSLQKGVEQCLMALVLNYCKE